MKNLQVAHIHIQKINGNSCTNENDLLAKEEPLEIKLEYSTATGRMQKNIAITMRTPGNDEDLAAGFLFTEGVIKNKADIESIKQSSADDNSLLVILKEDIKPQIANAVRNFYSTSSCGICGKASIEAIQMVSAYATIKNNFSITTDLIYNLPSKVKKQQSVFEDTGGIHAAALFNNNGDILLLKEDVGRHNALDKAIGHFFLADKLPLNNCILFLSGRAGFELLQKAAMAGIKMIVAIGAPSSLAVELAQENDITLIGFLRGNRFNIYSGKQRVIV
ncbi:MAG: formate dehydrogenase accessory sulfurtransferase FdhD [Ferruginibacter sp.]|nr:formate dehydrogenase accessory sulfurtransferase FdhD [Bacteroidota bacterium]MBX2918462.1 formate dehydrogenase accessory sulfurtransferase FdhD [Ferruginibacter sp.]MCB0708281.1 formate dehydrogenase accessory sulfurtransferase FdhD [Chitinophagaceae bacterium]MCC7378486.1 formate dehydrogenase accessory sulfurtransferase FdhD [Chitinophagaceae bacterium]